MDDLMSLDQEWSSDTNASTSKPLAPQSKPTATTSFDFLSKPASTNGPNYHSSSTPLRSTTPSVIPQNAGGSLLQPQISGTRPAGSGSSTPNTVPAPKPQPQPSSHDAFSSLLGGAGASSSSSTSKNLSLAERQAQAAEEKRRKVEHEKAQFEAHTSFWDNLGSAGSSSKPSPQADPGSSFGDILLPSSSAQSSRPASTAPQPNVLESSWDDSLLGGGPSANPASSSSSSRKPSPQPPADPFDFDELSSATDHLAVDQAGNKDAAGGSGMRTPVSDFDFVEREEVDSDVDVLGDLGRPAKPLSEAVQRSPSPPRVAERSVSNRQRRPVSPPPHVIGQIVEMGFSVAVAREALAKTPGGADVHAALETLMRQQEQPQRRDEPDHLHDRDRDARQREEEEKERRRRRRAGPSRDSVRPRTKEEQRAAMSSEFGESADKFISQASEIGQSVFSRASSLWNTGKERAMKAYEEQRRAMDAERNREPRKDGRPRWMVEQAGDGPVEDVNGSVGGGFKDSDDEDEGPEQPVRAVRQHADTRARKAAPRDRLEPRGDLLFEDEQPSSSAPRSHRPQPSTKPSHKPAPPRASPVAPLIKRNLIDATPHQVQTAASHRQTGNEHFKLGRFPEAESSYSRAISALPEGHLLLIPLHNNRAATRLKAGDNSAAIADSTVVIDIIGINYHPAKEEPLPSHLAEVKLGDALVKAMIKRAQAAEMAEKWAAAVEDWEKIAGLDAAILGNTSTATRNLAIEGGRRSRRMLSGSSEPRPKDAPKPAAKKPVPRPSRPADVSKSEAVAEMRKAAALNEAEDAQRLAVKDQVDAKVQAWKGGKEDNLRALIASLDTVLWDEILAGGLKVGMHELIQDKQVKIKYMKVVARLHPDKLSVSNTTVEQRMLAAAVFSVLSDAWQRFNSN